MLPAQPPLNPVQWWNAAEQLSFALLKLCWCWAVHCAAVFGEISYPPWQYTLRVGRLGQSDYLLNNVLTKVMLDCTCTCH
jgi:hypothetical protein